MTRTVRTVKNADTTIGSGLESGIVLVLFVGAGYLLDSWLGTRPIFTLGLFVLGAVGLFYRFKAAYTIRMEAHDAERRERLASNRGVKAEPATGGPATGGPATSQPATGEPATGDPQ
jgi:Putative F0F1-ATPase subunit Ca2+/Mg2+ transporter